MIWDIGYSKFVQIDDDQLILIKRLCDSMSGELFRTYCPLESAYEALIAIVSACNGWDKHAQSCLRLFCSYIKYES